MKILTEASESRLIISDIKPYIDQGSEAGGSQPQVRSVGFPFWLNIHSRDHELIVRHIDLLSLVPPYTKNSKT